MISNNHGMQVLTLEESAAKKQEPEGEFSTGGFKVAKEGYQLDSVSTAVPLIMKLCIKAVLELGVYTVLLHSTCLCEKFSAVFTLLPPPFMLVTADKIERRRRDRRDFPRGL